MISRRPFTQTQGFRIALKVVYIVLCVAAAVICLFPFLALLITVTKTSKEIKAGFSFSIGFSFFDNVQKLIEFMDMRGYSLIISFINSVIISFVSTAVCVYFSALTAYACHVYDFKGKAFFEKFILLLIIIPGQLGSVGFYRLVQEIYRIAPVVRETYLCYSIFILPAIASASTVFFLKQYLKNNFSKDYVDAARMDGASEFRIFNTICLPFIKSALATMALFGIIASWNNFMGPLIFIQNSSLYTLPLLIFNIASTQNVDLGVYYTATLLSMLPTVVVYFALHKFIIKGTSAGGIK